MRGGASIFDKMNQDDLILAFFPCTRFEAQVIMYFRGDANGLDKWNIEQKLKYAMDLHEELHHYYMLISKLVLIALKKNLKLVIENPYNEQHYLKRYWCIKPKIIDFDRRQWGDYFMKPTQYYFINFEPKNNLILDEGLEFVEKKKVIDCALCDKERSLIHPQYARRFIRSYLIDGNEQNL